ncbi:hypothetical protein C0J52_12311 [Blattella germanica]|nr:hypothetical protein C0J52_12311 [Blattella germanica]
MPGGAESYPERRIARAAPSIRVPAQTGTNRGKEAHPPRGQNTSYVQALIGEFYGASMYFDIGRGIKLDTDRIETIVNYTKGNGLILSIASNARSKLWYDVSTNPRGKAIEAYITTSELYVAHASVMLDIFMMWHQKLARRYVKKNALMENASLRTCVPVIQGTNIPTKATFVFLAVIGLGMSVAVLRVRKHVGLKCVRVGWCNNESHKKCDSLVRNTKYISPSGV